MRATPMPPVGSRELRARRAPGPSLARHRPYAKSPSSRRWGGLAKCEAVPRRTDRERATVCPAYCIGVTSYISHTSVDCRNSYVLAEWWKSVLGYTDLSDDPNEPGHPECMIVDPESGHQVLFIEVPEERSVKNRLHFDLRPRTGTRDEEVDRLLGVGATQVADLRGIYGPGSGWVVLADPEGNEFCVLRSVAELAE